MKTDAQFRFEKEALDVALATGSASVTFSTPGKAVQFRQRCYAFRKWKRETLGDASPYEVLTIRALEKGECTVEIHERKFDGVILPGDGKPLITPEPELSAEDLEELEIAKKNIGNLLL